jgi:hypothetical protein
MEATEWLDVFLPFTAVGVLTISASMAPVVVDALVELTEDDHEDEKVLPELDIMGFESHNPRLQQIFGKIHR